MDKNSLKNTLVDIGLSDKEAEIYLALLSLGPATVLALARVAGIKRTTIYSIIDALKQKGLINIEVRGFKQLFVAEPPSRLTSLLAAKQEGLKNTIPEFEAIYHLKPEGSFIKYYEGLAGVKWVYEDILQNLKKDDDYLVIADEKSWIELDRAYFQKFLERRAKIARTLQVGIRILLQNSEEAREHKKYEKNYFEKVKIISDDISLTTNLIITPREVVIHQLAQPVMAIVIKNPSVIQMHCELFEAIWKKT